MEALVVLGTGTEIGKTYVSRGLAKAWPGCCALKPVETGVTPGNQAEDAAALSRAANHDYQPPLYAFERPVSPHLEARRMARPIDLLEVRKWVAATARALGRERALVESAGGAFSPLATETFNADLAETLRAGFECRVLLVAPDRLGVLHDVVATQRALAAHSRAADAIVLSQGTAGEQRLGNAEELRALQPAPVFEVAHGAPSPPTLVRYLEETFRAGH
ncbi:MAG: dethiobiotin synthase [Polyangiaceae bacterium]|nr:dethiobiotin synthase [Myxococcales bacterium]MCB9585405.1 dethiobiotin synthase [Polyangiaceae bacterium]MCB9606580.1 dethiobiotin synthase [Polyangiaceae bacterium]